MQAKSVDPGAWLSWCSTSCRMLIRSPVKSMGCIATGYAIETHTIVELQSLVGLLFAVFLISLFRAIDRGGSFWGAISGGRIALLTCPPATVIFSVPIFFLIDAVSGFEEARLIHALLFFNVVVAGQSLTLWVFHGSFAESVLMPEVLIKNPHLAAAGPVFLAIVWAAHCVPQSVSPIIYVICVGIFYVAYKDLFGPTTHGCPSAVSRTQLMPDLTCAHDP